MTDWVKIVFPLIFCIFKLPIVIRFPNFCFVPTVSVLVFVSVVFWVGLLDSFSIVGVDGIVAGLSVVFLVYPLWLRHGRILKKAVGMGCLRVFEHPLIPRLWLQISVIVHGF
jgi:hypothetical protein